MKQSPERKNIRSSMDFFFKDLVFCWEQSTVEGKHKAARERVSLKQLLLPSSTDENGKALRH